MVGGDTLLNMQKPLFGCDLKIKDALGRHLVNIEVRLCYGLRLFCFYVLYGRNQIHNGFVLDITKFLTPTRLIF